MITAIHALHDAVEQYIASGSSAPSCEEGTVFDMCDTLFSDLATLQRDYKTLEIAVHGINQCYLMLVHLLNRAWYQTIDLVLLSLLRETMETFQSIYGHDIASSHELCLFDQEKLKHSTSEQFTVIRPQLLKKKIPKEYIAEIQYALDALFQHGKLPELKFYHQSYLQNFMGALTHLAQDHREKDWSFRMIVLLIQYNFNHLGFFNRWSENMEADLQALDSPQSAYPLLQQLQAKLRKSYHLTNTSYDMNQRSLLEHMSTWTGLKLEEVHLRIENEPLEQFEGLWSLMNSDEMTVLFHYTYKAKLLNYSTKREAAKAFVLYVKSKTGRTISYKTLEKFDKNDLEAAAISIRRKLKEILTNLGNDFKL